MIAVANIPSHYTTGRLHRSLAHISFRSMPRLQPTYSQTDWK